MIGEPAIGSRMAFVYGAAVAGSNGTRARTGHSMISGTV